MTITADDLPDIIAKHTLWLRSEPGGARANLAGAYLAGANLTDAYLAGANLTGANLTGANLTDAYLARANLTDAYLTGANLARANLTGAYLAGANLTGAYLTGAYLTDAYLAGAYLTGANLTGAYLTGANLARANLTGANLAGAKFENTKWRNGVIITRAPIQIAGLHYIVHILDTHMQIGCELHSLADWASFDNERIARMDGVAARKFWDQWKTPLLLMAAADGRQ